MDATFWSLVALVIFAAILMALKVPGMVVKSLDERADKIRGELHEARRLREEAQLLLAELQRKRKEAEQEAEAMIVAAGHEAEAFVAEARQKSADYVARRTRLAERKIAMAEAEAIDAVRRLAAGRAVAAAGALIAEKIDGEKADKLFRASVAEMKRRLN